MKIPTKIQKEIKHAVFQKADNHGYMHSGRIENGVFMENLLSDPEVGGRLVEFMPRAGLKTYIKDSLLNSYSKSKTAADLDTDLPSLIKRVLSYKSEIVERDSRVSLHSLENGAFVVVSGGTLLKWETALRRALEFIANAPGLPHAGKELYVLLNLSTLGRVITGGDRRLIEKSLAFVNVRVAFSSSH